MRWFMVVGRCQPLFECDINATAPAVEDATHMHQFALHSALDLVEKAAQTKQHMYLGAVDKFNDQPIFAFLSPGNITFLLQYDGRSEEGVRVRRRRGAQQPCLCCPRRLWRTTRRSRSARPRPRPHYARL